MNVWDIGGLLGALLISWCYFYAQYSIMFSRTTTFYVGNIMGSLLIILSLLLSSFNLPSLLIEVLWIIVSFFGIYNLHSEYADDIIDLTYRENELGIGGIKTKINKMVRDDREILGVDTMECQVGGVESQDRIMKTEPYLLNGTTMLTPNAISNSLMGVNEAEHLDSQRRCYFIRLEERNYGAGELKVLFDRGRIGKSWPLLDTGERPILFLVTGFMEKIDGFIGKNGNIDKNILDITRAGLLLDAAEFVRDLNLFSAIVIDSISFEPSGGEKTSGIETTTALMNIDEQRQDFTPLIYQARTPSLVPHCTVCSIILGNIPAGIVPKYPVSIKVK